MYRRFYRNDELISNVLISFALLLLFGMLISWKLVGINTFDAEMIVYIVFGSLSFLLFVFSLVLFLLGNRKQIIDIEVDVKNREIRTFNGRFTFSFDDIRLYSFNKRHRQVRLLVKRKLFGFSIDEMKSGVGSITSDHLEALYEGATVVEPKVLYNYHLLTNLVVIGWTVLYLILASTRGLLLFGIYIPTYYAIALCITLCIVIPYLNLYRMKKIEEKHTIIDTNTEPTDTTIPPTE